MGLINSFIHVCMYAYYMLAAMGPQVQKHLWWKKYLTVMQIIQFLIVFVHTIQIQFQSDCGFPKSIGALLTLNAGLFTYMFGSFYIRSYNRPTRNGRSVSSDEEECSKLHSSSSNVICSAQATSQATKSYSANGSPKLKKNK